MKKTVYCFLFLLYTVVCISGTYYYCRIDSSKEANGEKSTLTTTFVKNMSDEAKERYIFSLVKTNDLSPTQEDYSEIVNQRMLDNWPSNPIWREVEMGRVQQFIRKREGGIRARIDDFAKPSGRLINYANCQLSIKALENQSAMDPIAPMMMNALVGYGTESPTEIHQATIVLHFLSPDSAVERYTLMQFSEDGKPIFMEKEMPFSPTFKGLYGIEFFGANNISERSLLSRCTDQGEYYHCSFSALEDVSLMFSSPCFVSFTDGKGVHSSNAYLIPDEFMVQNATKLREEAP